MVGHKEDLIAQVCRILDSRQWHYKRREDKNLVDFSIHIQGKLNRCDVFIEAGDVYMLCYAFCPINASEDVRPVVAEYLTRANYGLKCGNFELDYRDGEVRYKTYLYCPEEVPTIDEIEYHIDVAITMMQRYGDGLVKCLMGFGDPEKDVAEAEAEP